MPPYKSEVKTLVFWDAALSRWTFRYRRLERAQFKGHVEKQMHSVTSY